MGVLGGYVGRVWWESVMGGCDGRMCWEGVMEGCGGCVGRV